MVKDFKDDQSHEDEEGSGGDGGTSGGTGSTGGAGGAGGWVPNYYELMGLKDEEKNLKELVDQEVFYQRISLKSQGHEVTALSKMQKLRNQLREPGMENNLGGGSNLAEHPLLPDMDGALPDNLVLPESEAAERSNDPNLRLKYSQRMAAKFGISTTLSMQAIREELEKKMKYKAQPQLDPRPHPEFQPAPTPEPVPTPRYTIRPPRPM